MPYTGSGELAVNAGSCLVKNIKKLFCGMHKSNFRRLDTYHGFNVFKQSNQYGNLCIVLLDSQAHSVDYRHFTNLAVYDCHLPLGPI